MNKTAAAVSDPYPLIHSTFSIERTYPQPPERVFFAHKDQAMKRRWLSSLIYILTGAIGLLAAGYVARLYAFGLGLVYLVIAIWGFIIGSGDAILTIGPVNTADNVLHLILGVLGILAGAAGGGAYLAYSSSNSSA